MFRFNQAQVLELIQAIDKTHIVFIGEQLGTDLLTSEDKRVLSEFGVDWKKISKTGKVDDMFRLGMLSQALGQDSARTMSYEKLKQHISSGKFLPLSPVEQSTLDSIKLQAYSDLKGLGNKVSRDFSQVLIEVDVDLRNKFQDIIRNESEIAVKQRKTVAQLSSALKNKTKDWARDFDRIADYIMHTALDAGIAAQILRTQGEEAEVYKDVYPGACVQCVKAYLVAGIGSPPKVFKLREIIANGNNIGRKQQDWKPVIGPHHPWCRCTLQLKFQDSQWDQDAREFVDVRNTRGVKRTSKPKIYVEF